MSTVGFSYGCLADKLEKQARAQGYTLGKAAAEYERCREALITLRFGIDTPDSIHDKLIKRLHARVIKHLKTVPKNVVEGAVEQQTTKINRPLRKSRKSAVSA
jgi:hypothetical protein